MSAEVPEFESWNEFNEFLESASSEELHALALKHAECWASLSYCDEDQMLWDETAQYDELIFTRVLVAPNVDRHNHLRIMNQLMKTFLIWPPRCSPLPFAQRDWQS